MNITKFLAKSSGEGIISHTDKVNNNIEKLIPFYNLTESEKDILRSAGKLHDIAKLIKKMQSFLKTGKDIIDNDRIKFKHNVIGWYFIAKYVNHPEKQKISHLVLWHHANHNSCENLGTKLLNIKNEITEDDLSVMKEFCKHYNIPLKEIGDCDEDFDFNTKFYQESKESFDLLRSILITADVCASANICVDNLFDKEIIPLSSIDKDFLNSKRTQKQLDIIKLIDKIGTTLINAPTGFGKTMIGIIWALLSGTKLIWVCPTNTIASSIYEDILRDLEKLGIKITVELYLTGERRKANNLLEDFTSDIIVTNIDNFVKPTVSNSYGHRALMIYGANVLFDEVHVYDSMDCPLFEAFNKIMDIRHNKLHSATLLLTATKTTFRFLNKGGHTIKVLPNEKEHYESVHSEEYVIHFHDKVPTELMFGEFVFFCNTVDDTQIQYQKYKGQKLISHGRYSDDEEKELKKNAVLSNYGKDGQRIPYGVFTNEILTTSCNYSVRKMFIKCPTIQSFFQSLGRLNRWGGMGETHIHVILEKSKKDTDSQNKNTAIHIIKIYIIQSPSIPQY